MEPVKYVFLTGATGVLGSALGPLFFDDGDTRLILLMRADSPDHLEQRKKELFAYWQLDCPHSTLAARIEVIRGNIGEIDLGMGIDAFGRLAGKVTHIIHAAGNVKLNQTLNQARKSAVDSARNVLEFAKTCHRNGQFRKLDLVSTVGIAGATPGLITERPYDEPRHYRNTYEAAKAEAEDLVWAAICDGLPGTIHRPSMIVGDSRTGKVRQFQVYYHLTDFLAGRKTWGLIPQTNATKLDIIPVDYVAQAIYDASNNADAEGKIYHLCSGPDKSWTLDELTRRIRSLFEERGQTLPRLWKLPLPVAKHVYNLLGKLYPTKKRRFFKGLPFVLDYLDIHQQFDNLSADAFLSRKGLNVPPVDSYLGVIMNAYWNNNPMGETKSHLRHRPA